MIFGFNFDEWSGSGENRDARSDPSVRVFSRMVMSLKVSHDLLVRSATSSVDFGSLSEVRRSSFSNACSPAPTPVMKDRTPFDCCRKFGVHTSFVHGGELSYKIPLAARSRAFDVNRGSPIQTHLQAGGKHDLSLSDARSYQLPQCVFADPAC